MPEKDYLIFLDFDVRKRHYHATEAGRIRRFVVQLEIKVEDKWKEVLRYDCAHDFAHKDCYDLRGRCIKIAMFLNYEDALTFADDDINNNWELYRERFLKGYFP